MSFIIGILLLIIGYIGFFGSAFSQFLIGRWNDWCVLVGVLSAMVFLFGVALVL